MTQNYGYCPMYIGGEFDASESGESPIHAARRRVEVVLAAAREGHVP